MKKFYAILGMMLSCGLAYAGPQFMHKSEFQKFAPEGINPEMRTSASHDTKKHKPMHAPVALEDVYGQYLWVGASALSTSNGGWEQGDITIYPSGNDNEVYVFGINLWSSVPILAYIDADEGTISFPNGQVVGTGENGYTEAGVTYDVEFCHLYPDADGVSVESDDLVGYFAFDNDGNFVGFDFDFYDMFALWIPDLNGGFFAEYGNMMLQRPEELNSEGWVDSGMATVSDLWFSGLVELETGAPVSPYQVLFQTNVENPNLVRLVDPFGPSSPYMDFSVSLAEGQVRFDLTNPDAVAVDLNYDMLLGYAVDENGETDYDQPVYVPCAYYSGFMMTEACFYPDNAVNYYLQEGFTYEDIIEGFQEINLTPSTYKDGVITVTDPFMSMSFDVHAGYTSWADIYGLNASFGTPKIVLDMSGVEGINSDDINAPIKYYNLQGVEISNPAKGQIVIQKQGKKTSKFVAR